MAMLSAIFLNMGFNQHQSYYFVWREFRGSGVRSRQESRRRGS